MFDRRLAAAELLRRRSIKGSLAEWCRFKGYEPARHHLLLIRELEDIAAGRNRRLMVFMPPGSAKSTYTSQLFVPWYMGQLPANMVVAASHTQELADRWGRKCRNLVAEDGRILGISLSDDSQAAGRWGLDQGGEYFAVGVGGSVTGRRADLAVIDDPIRGREDADSPVVREKTIDWYRSDLYTRLKPGAAVIIIQTRWHEADLSGQLLDAMKAGGDQWRVINLPALAGENDPLGRSPGDALWPEWESAEALHERRANMLPREWAALYQQNPVPEDGDYFKAPWIRTTATMPATDTLKVFGASDYAVTADGGDWTTHIVVGIDPEQRLYVLDLYRAQASSDAWIEAWCDLVKKWKPLEWAEEKGQIASGVGPFLQRRAIERQAWTHRRQFASKADKAVRAQSIRGRMAMQGLYIPATAPWKADLVSELLQFPAGKHDDQVDALGLVGQLLDHAKGYAPPAPKAEKPTTPTYQVMPNGRVQTNMSLRDIIEAKAKRRENWS